MAERQIFVVSAYIVDANGSYSVPTGYPKEFDSKHYDNDVEKTKRKADGDASTVWAGMCNSDAGRQLQMVNLQTVEGYTISGYPKCLGALAEVK